MKENKMRAASCCLSESGNNALRPLDWAPVARALSTTSVSDDRPKRKGRQGPDTHKAKRVTEERDGASEDARLKRQKIGIWLKTFCCVL